MWRHKHNQALTKLNDISAAQSEASTTIAHISGKIDQVNNIIGGTRNLQDQSFAKLSRIQKDVNSLSTSQSESSTRIASTKETVDRISGMASRARDVQNQALSELGSVTQDIKCLGTSQSEATTIMTRTEGKMNQVHGITLQTQSAIHELANRVLYHDKLQIPDSDIARLTKPVETMIRGLFLNHQITPNLPATSEKSSYSKPAVKTVLPIREQEPTDESHQTQQGKIDAIISQLTNSSC